MSGDTDEWRPVAGYEGYYEVTKTGLVRSLPRHYPVKRKGRQFTQFRKGQLIAIRVGRQGYHTVYLSAEALGKPGSHHLVHRLVLAAFVGPCPDGLIGCHYDGNPANNNVENLRWDTHAANTADTLRHGRHPQASKTHCLAGHEYDRRTPDGYRRCRTCHARWKREQRARKAVA